MGQGRLMGHESLLMAYSCRYCNMPSWAGFRCDGRGYMKNRRFDSRVAPGSLALSLCLAGTMVWSTAFPLPAFAVVTVDDQELSQESMARMAVASGKFFGVGIGSTIQARLMTQANNDLIYAIIIEESGMLGGIIVLLLYVYLYIRCIKIKRR